MLKKVKKALEKVQSHQKTLQNEDLLVSLLENIDYVPVKELQAIIDKYKII